MDCQKDDFIKLFGAIAFMMIIPFMSGWLVALTLYLQVLSKRTIIIT